MRDEPTLQEPETEADWAAVSDASEARRSATKTVIYNIGTKDRPIPAKFRVRMLRQQDVETIGDRAVRIDPSARGGDRVRTDSTLAKRLTIQFGVVDGPKGWQGSKDNLDRVVADVELCNWLAGCIEKFTTLPDETREGFR